MEGGYRELFEGTDPVVIAFRTKMAERRSSAQQHLDGIDRGSRKMGTAQYPARTRSIWLPVPFGIGIRSSRLPKRSTILTAP